MAGSFRRLGVILLALTLAVGILNELLGLNVPALQGPLLVQVGALGLAMIAGGILLSIVGGAAGKVAGKRCPRCGRRVAKNQIYCRDHAKAALDQLRDRDRSYEETQYGRRK